jgi:hypothetical protein
VSIRERSATVKNKDTQTVIRALIKRAKTLPNSGPKVDIAPAFLTAEDFAT